MNHKMAMTTNVRRFLAAVRELMDRPVGIEGMGLLWGQPGEGKTTSIAFVINQMDGLCVRVLRDWTPSSFLGAIMIEVGLEPMRIRAKMVDKIAKQLLEHPRPILVDEAQRLSDHMTGSLRDLYDVTGCPVVIVGDERLARKSQMHDRLAGRITQWVEFRGISLPDARTLADTVCEVVVEEDLLAHLHQAAAKNIRRMNTGLSRIEQFAKLNKLESVNLSQWGDRPLFFDQPIFRRGR